jgi:hypothetical protein
MSFDEAAWWGDCANTFHEEEKQLVYAPRLGLVPNWNCGHPPLFDLGGRSVVDIGGGPVSLLLKCVNFGPALVVDPAPYPEWVRLRYEEHKVSLTRARGEDFESNPGFDEAWIYNVLQHVDDPHAFVRNAQKHAKVLRLFEWIDLPAYDGHPQALTQELLEEAIGAPGFVVDLNQSGAVGRAFYGVFAVEDV